MQRETLPVCGSYVIIEVPDKMFLCSFLNCASEWYQNDLISVAADSNSATKWCQNDLISVAAVIKCAEV